MGFNEVLINIVFFIFGWNKNVFILGPNRLENVSLKGVPHATINSVGVNVGDNLREAHCIS